MPLTDMDYDLQVLKRQMLVHLKGEEASYPGQLEAFPHILAKTVELWGKPALDDYLQSLMMPDRVDRKGFPPDVAAAIFRLSFLHGSLGLSQEQKVGGWGGVGDSEINRFFEGRSGRE